MKYEILGFIAGFITVALLSELIKFVVARL